MRSIFLITIFLMIAFPSLVKAQAVSSHKFSGTVTINGKSPDKAVVTAIIDDFRATSSNVVQGRYTLSVVQPPGEIFYGKTISFEVDGSPTNVTATWRENGIEILDLIIRDTPESTPRPWIKPISTPTANPTNKPDSSGTSRPWVKPLPTKNTEPKIRPGSTIRPKLKDRPAVTLVPKVNQKSPIKIPLNAPGTDLEISIESGSGRERTNLICTGISPNTKHTDVRCQVLDARYKSGSFTRLGPTQWPIIVKNIGDVAVSDYIVDIVLSSDLTAPVTYAPPLGSTVSEDILIEPGRLDAGPPLGPKSSAVVHLGIGPLPNWIRTGEYGICAVVDPGNLVLETNETNNVFCLPILIHESSNSESGFSGSVLVDDNPVSEDAIIASYINGHKISESMITDGAYSLLIEQPQNEDFQGKPVEFRLFLPDATGGEPEGILLDQTGAWEAGNIARVDFKLRPKRGIFLNPPIGELGFKNPWNNIDTNLLSAVGIILTLLTAGLTLFKDD